MKELIKGLRRFKSEYFCRNQQLFEKLAHGQQPRVLFITCSDSRVDPELLTSAAPGEIFVIRNAGNIVPPYGATNGGEGATIEYAVQVLGIDQIVVCGHSHCGAMKGLLKLETLREELPLVYEWLKHAEGTRRLLQEHYGDRTGEDLLDTAIAENVLTQIENLRTYPVIRAGLFNGDLKIYAWIYDIDTGEVVAYDPETHAYVPPQSLLSPEELDAELLTPAIEGCALPTSSNGFSSQPTTASTREMVPANQRFPFVYMSPEQADRIYRGSKASR
ncbi:MULTISPECIES: carbonic anhydrase [unclassified Leptolyngbya]|uniref:carbonic anhydrase n=1 Tax=unclassified Leptolyngbya TaxID=2650499 RepID=UPI0016853C65|nr:MULTISPECIES: carbonic anhydrase [unclassified Leptolyngbya]MBD1909706.1 carbonic anhydrase [Leptolyngbya sp. FACHB-8]MBD2155972.1 carbonic anhydrase [Leptolyngbya sp. FACHB-16]